MWRIVVWRDTSQTISFSVEISILNITAVLYFKVCSWNLQKQPKYSNGKPLLKKSEHVIWFVWVSSSLQILAFSYDDLTIRSIKKDCDRIPSRKFQDLSSPSIIPRFTAAPQLFENGQHLEGKKIKLDHKSQLRTEQ